MNSLKDSVNGFRVVSMKRWSLRISLATVLCTTFLAQGAIRYVDLNSPAPSAPYLTWNTAATNIQDAVDVADADDLVLVNDGLYQTGGQVVGTSGTNRVTVTKPLILQSLNGPAVTTIAGYQMPDTTNGAAAIRCVYLTNGAMLSGFTLTGGATPQWSHSGGGVLGAGTNVLITVSNCVIAGNAAGQEGGAGAANCTLLNSVLVGNRSDYNAGGAFNSILNSCSIVSNTAAAFGGGARGSTLTNCVLIGNRSAVGGGGNSSIFYSCLFSGNIAGIGGGASSSRLYNCAIQGNQALGSGGGTAFSHLNNCIVSDNIALNGGGVAISFATNCTIVGNFANNSGGGAYFWGTSNGKPPSLHNCILYFNHAPHQPNHAYSDYGSISYSCTTPLPAGGGNISGEPQLANSFRLTANSPCRGAGDPSVVTGFDVDGEPWLNPPSIGCDEWLPDSLTGPLDPAIIYDAPVLAGFPSVFRALINGRVAASRWDFGDGTIVSNVPYVLHTWTSPGEYLVTLTAYNESHPDGVSTTITVDTTAGVGGIIPWGQGPNGAVNIPPGLIGLVTAIDAGPEHGLALKTDGTVTSWGTMNGVSITNPSPAGLSNVVMISAGFGHNLALKRDGTVTGWGGNSWDQSNPPPGATNIIAVSAGYNFSAALKSNGTVIVWGLIQPPFTGGYNLTNVPPLLSNVVAIACRNKHILALRSDGTVVAWGQNSDGQTNVPPGLNHVVAIAAGDFISLALKSDGSMVAWGSLYNGTNNVPFTPPSNATNLVALDANGSSVLGLRADGTVIQWGWVSDSAIYFPVSAPAGLMQVIDFAAGGQFFLALIGDEPISLETPLMAPSMAEGRFNISIPTLNGKVYAPEYRSSLSEPDWNSLPLHPGTGDIRQITDPDATNSHRFYRVRRW